MPSLSRLKSPSGHASLRHTSMTPPNNSSDPMSKHEFETRLYDLISEARDRNAPIYGAYSIRSPDPNVQDYDAEITEVVNRENFQLFGNSNE